MRTRLILVIALVTALTVSLVAASGASAAKAGKGKLFGKEALSLVKDADGNVVGMVATRYKPRPGKNGRLIVRIVLTGLAPNSTHAWHLHGDGPGNCKNPTDGVVVPFDDMTADANGVVVLRTVVTKVAKNPLRRGAYFNIHAMSSADGVGDGIACGDLRKAVV